MPATSIFISAPSVGNVRHRIFADFRLARRDANGRQHFLSHLTFLRCAVSRFQSDEAFWPDAPVLAFYPEKPRALAASPRLRSRTMPDAGDFALPEESAILVAEVTCAVPGCPPIETVIAFWSDERPIPSQDIQAGRRGGGGRPSAVLVQGRARRAGRFRVRLLLKRPGEKHPMADLKLKTVTRTQGNNRALKDGTVKPRDLRVRLRGGRADDRGLPPYGAR